MKLGREADESTERLKAQFGRTWHAYQALDDEEREEVHRKGKQILTAAQNKSLREAIDVMLKENEEKEQSAVKEKAKRLRQLESDYKETITAYPEQAEAMRQVYEEEKRKILES